MLEKFLKLLMLYLVLGVEGEEETETEETPTEETTEDEATGTEETTTDETETADDLESLVETDDEPVTTKSRENSAIRDARRRAQEAEEARIRAEATLEAERRVRTQQPSQDQVLFEQEEARLRDPEVSEQEKWQIKSNRVLRDNTRASQQALTTAADMRDSAEFDRLATTKPKVYAKYKDRVEKLLSDARGQGQNYPRMVLLKLAMGDDLVNGKLQSTPRKKSADTVIDRSKPASARSDVGGKGKLTEHQKREKRLENVHI